ncbi:putative oxidoreductase [Ustulina deusta]|nr:putative oxidoreductase [Ustulina deusta]
MIAQCTSLLDQFGSKVIISGTDEFDDYLSSYYTKQSATLRPLCIVSPTTSDDVSSIVQTISLLSETIGEHDSSRCHFAVRSGGHGIPEGASNIADGVTIDLRSLDGIEIKEGNIASLGVGATWDQVYIELEPLGLSVAGGRNAGVGVGGLTTGGGISYFSPRYGWSCDSIVNFEVVLANGSIVNANADENPELASALRGGSNNFGIVTRIDMQAFEQGLLWGGLSFYDLSTAADHLKAFVDFNSPVTYDPYSSLITTYVLMPGMPPSIATNLEYTKPEPNPPHLQPLLSIPALSSTMRLATMAELSIELLALQPYGLRQLYVQTTHSSTLPMLNATFRRWSESLNAVQDVPDMAWCLSLEPLPPHIYARAPDLNSLGLEDRTGSLVITLLTATWSDEADDAKITAEAQALMAHIENDARSLSAYDPFVYINYAASWQDPIRSYGAEQVNRFRKIRQQFDGKGLFTRNVHGGFKIPE